MPIISFAKANNNLGVVMKILVLLALFFSQSAFSKLVFNVLRNDNTVPESCREFTQKHFEGNIEYFTYGISGSSHRGFTYEVPIRRDVAHILWKALRNDEEDFYKFESKLRRTPTLEKILSTILDSKDDMDFDFEAEGEVLELLALKDLEQHYSPDKHFFTGGISYRKESGGRTIGELDLVVGSKSDCSIIAVGESKLGSHRLRKAKEQLQRFQTHLNKN